MKLLSDLSSTRTNLLQVELLSQESGQLSALRVTVGLPLAVGIALIEIVRICCR
jgi:hypothetical protein